MGVSMAAMATLCSSAEVAAWLAAEADILDRIDATLGR